MALKTPYGLNDPGYKLKHDHSLATPTSPGFLSTEHFQYLDNYVGDHGDVVVDSDTSVWSLATIPGVEGVYGGLITVPVISVDDKGRIISASSGTIRSASTTSNGIVRLNDTVTSTSVGMAATANSVKVTYDLAAAAIPLTQKGAASGVAPLDANSLIPSQYLPAFVDDVQEYASTAAFPATGVSGVIYVALNNNRQYRWGGSSYINITSGPTADEALKLTNARSIAATGDISWSVVFDGSADATASATLVNTGVIAGTYRSLTVDAKGRVTGGTNPTTLSGYGITDAAKTDGTNATGTWQIDISGKAKALNTAISTASTGGANANKFYKYGTIALANMSDAVYATLLLRTKNESAGDFVEVVTIKVCQVVAFGNNPMIIELACTSLTDRQGGQLVYAITQNTPTTNIDLYHMVGVDTTTVDITILTQSGNGVLSLVAGAFVTSVAGGVTIQKSAYLRAEAISANTMPYFDSTSHKTVTTPLTSFARTLLDDADAATARTTLGLGTAATVAATSFQTASSELTALAALSGTGLIRKTGVNTYAFDSSTYLTGNQSISVTGDATGSGNTAIALTLSNSGVTAGTYPKVTVDAKGRVTAGAALAATDIPVLDAGKITTGVFALARLPTASTSAVGVVQLDSTVTSTSTSTAATASAVKAAYDLANSANTAAGAAIPASQKGAANGVAPLDANGKVPVANLPNTGGNGLSYLGTWNPATNTPTLTSTPASAGSYYVVAGGSGTFLSEDYNPKDWIISDGTAWSKIDNTDNVTSVAGKTGAVTLTKSDVGLSNVDNTSDANKPVSTAQQAALDTKVDKVAGKGLSTEDYTTAEKTKLSGIQAGAQVNPAIADAATAKAGTDNTAMMTSLSTLAALMQTGLWDNAVVYSDLNAVPAQKTHFIKSTDTAANRPTSDSREYAGICIWHSSVAVRQLVFCVNTGVKALYYRNGNGSPITWDSTWTQIYDTSNLIMQTSGQDTTTNAVLRHGAWTLGSQTRFNQYSQSFTGNTWTALSQYVAGGTTLVNGWVYKVRTSVSGVATANANTFAVYQTAAGVFAVQRFGRASNSTTNEQQLRIASNNMLELLNVNASAQTVQIYIEAYFAGNTTANSLHWFGIEAFLQQGDTGALMVQRSGMFRTIWDETTLVKMTNNYDATAGSMMVNGAWGRGASTFTLQTNADTITAAGDYAVGTSWTGSPFAGTDARNAGTLTHLGTDAVTEATQRFVSESVGDIDLVRVKRAGTWGAWTRQWNTSNLTVSATAPSNPYVGQLWVDTAGV